MPAKPHTARRPASPSPDLPEDNPESSLIRSLTFPRDRSLRKRLFVQASFDHQARANLYLLRWCLRRYTAPGDVVLDPMAGTGSLLIAAAMQRHVVLCELEPHWTDVILANAQRFQQTANPLFDDGAVFVLEGDATRLDLPDCSVDHVLFSPPYWDTFSDWNITSSGYQGEPGDLGQAYADDRGTPSSQTTPDGRPAKNVGNLHTYDHYLRAMRLVYAQCRRVLRPGGLCLVIVKDRVHKKRRVPITRDTATLLQAIGLTPAGRHAVKWPLSRYRRLLAQKHPGAPVIDTETVLVFRKPIAPVASPEHPLALILRPNGDYAPRSAPMLLFEKAKAHAASLDADVIVLDDVLPNAGFARRRAWCFKTVSALVDQGDIHSGTHVLSYLPQRYATYVRDRLETLGCTVEEPTAGMNMGQKLAYLTEELSQPMLL